ncbi:MAG: hypothetical protein DI533_10085 [Cereibacter sphaeroides]|uniref:Uncharacterized protein n=1 Tax=Cereibacter sphaeroides TaxID=1063 RepID=A0A2W5SG82_CERSP|nr:MAG: hypothetical protein DI533_10085 [Cereibacter sphaeroides]
MARLILASGFNLKNLGYAVLDAATTSNKSAAEDAIRAMVVPQFSDKLVFHYDSAAAINIVIPNITLSGPADSGGLNDVAAEAIGSIVIYGCAN